MSRSPLATAYLGFGLLGAAVLGAFVFDRTHRPAPTPAAAVVAPAHAATAPAAPAVDPVPERRPDFTLRDLDGKPRRIAEWDGKPLVVNFWATWCAPCRREIPLLNRLQHEYGDHGLQVVGVAVDFAEDVRKFAHEVKLGYPVLVGEDDGLEAARGFGVEAMAFPFTAFTDAAGHVLVVHLGELHENQARAILGIVADVDGGRMTVAAAPGAIRKALAALPKADPAPANALTIHPVQGASGQ